MAESSGSSNYIFRIEIDLVFGHHFVARRTVFFCVHSVLLYFVVSARLLTVRKLMTGTRHFASRQNQNALLDPVMSVEQTWTWPPENHCSSDTLNPRDAANAARFGK